MYKPNLNHTQKITKLKFPFSLFLQWFKVSFLFFLTERNWNKFEFKKKTIVMDIFKLKTARPKNVNFRLKISLRKSPCKKLTSWRPNLGRFITGVVTPRQRRGGRPGRRFFGHHDDTAGWVAGWAGVLCSVVGQNCVVVKGWCCVNWLADTCTF